MRYPYGLALAFGSGGAVAGVLYAASSVFLFGFIERAWGAWASFQVVLVVALAFAVLSGVAFGVVLALLGAPAKMETPLRPHLSAAVFGAVSLVVAGVIAFSLQSLESLAVATSAFVSCASVAAVAYRRRLFVPKHAAS